MSSLPPCSSCMHEMGFVKRLRDRGTNCCDTTIFGHFDYGVTISGSEWSGVLKWVLNVFKVVQRVWHIPWENADLRQSNLLKICQSIYHSYASLGNDAFFGSYGGRSHAWCMCPNYCTSNDLIYHFVVTTSHNINETGCLSVCLKWCDMCDIADFLAETFYISRKKNNFRSLFEYLV